MIDLQHLQYLPTGAAETVWYRGRLVGTIRQRPGYAEAWQYLPVGTTSWLWADTRQDAARRLAASV